jgi:hypothetical protein
MPEIKQTSLQAGAYVVLSLAIVASGALGALGVISEDNAVRGVGASLATLVYLLTRNGSGTPPKLTGLIGWSAAAGELLPVLSRLSCVHAILEAAVGA